MLSRASLGNSCIRVIGTPAVNRTLESNGRSAGSGSTTAPRASSEYANRPSGRCSRWPAHPGPAAYGRPPLGPGEDMAAVRPPDVTGNDRDGLGDDLQDVLTDPPVQDFSARPPPAPGGETPVKCLDDRVGAVQAGGVSVAQQAAVAAAFNVDEKGSALGRPPALRRLGDHLPELLERARPAPVLIGVTAAARSCRPSPAAGPCQQGPLIRDLGEVGYERIVEVLPDRVDRIVGCVARVDGQQVTRRRHMPVVSQHVAVVASVRRSVCGAWCNPG